MAVSTAYARLIIDSGFEGVPTTSYEDFEVLGTDERGNTRYGKPIGPGTDWEYVPMRDMPPMGLTPSRTTEIEIETDEDGGQVNIAMRGPVLADGLGDFIVSIEMPEVEVLPHRAVVDGESWPFQEFWLPPDLVNAHLHTLVIYNSEDGEETPPDLVGK